MFDENRIVSRFLEVDEELYRGKEYFRKERRASRLTNFLSDSDYYSDTDSDSVSDYDSDLERESYFKGIEDYFNSIAEDRYDDDECIEI